MRAIGAPPEADLTTVASGDLAGLSMPILVAAATWEQFDEFVWEQALFCSEVRRYRHLGDMGLDEGKILLLLPGYEHDEQTADAVDLWVNHEDRYTAQLDSPQPGITKGSAVIGRSILLMAAAAGAALCVWAIFY
jgi:hypothetical protein